MYESITYEELKSLPRDQKVEALKELRALYPTQKKIAEKLGVNPANIYNMIAKYVKEEDEGQQKADVKAAKKALKPAKRKSRAYTETKAGAEAEGGTVSEVKTSTEEEARPIAGTEAATGPAAGTQTARAELLGESKAGTGVNSEAVVNGSLKARVRRTGEKKMKTEENLRITLSKSLTGEEAQALFCGISSIFLKNHDYRLEIRVIEG